MRPFRDWSDSKDLWNTAGKVCWARRVEKGSGCWHSTPKMKNWWAWVDSWCSPERFLEMCIREEMVDFCEIRRKDRPQSRDLKRHFDLNFVVVENVYLERCLQIEEWENFSWWCHLEAEELNRAFTPFKADNVKIQQLKWVSGVQKRWRRVRLRWRQTSLWCPKFQLFSHHCFWNNVKIWL